MKFERKAFVLFIIINLFILSTVYAGDNLYHFMQAHQDYIVVGKIIDKKSKNECTIEVSELIDESSIRRDIPKIIKVNPDSFIENFEIGDYIAISLSKRGGGYQLENGAFKVTTNNTDTLEVIDLEVGYQSSELAAIELFLKSRGKIKDFYFVEDKTYVHSEPFKITEKDICIYSEEIGKVLPQEFEKNEKNLVASNNHNLEVIICLIVAVSLLVAVGLFEYSRKRTHGYTICPQKIKCLKTLSKGSGTFDIKFKNLLLGYDLSDRFFILNSKLL